MTVKSISPSLCFLASTSATTPAPKDIKGIIFVSSQERLSV